MLYEKLIKKSDRLLVAEKNPDAPSSQYPLEEVNMNILLHSIFYHTSARVSLVPLPMPEAPDIEEDRFKFSDDEDYVSTEERIRATGIIDGDVIYVADCEQGEKPRHEEVEITIRRIPPITTEDNQKKSENEYKFEFAREGGGLIHWCGSLLEGDNHEQDYLVVEVYVLDEVFDMLKGAITSPTERIEKIIVGLRVRMFWSEMDQALREFWMSRDLIILRDTRTPAAVTSLQIQRRPILQRVVEHDEELGDIETDRFEDNRDETEERVSSIISPADLKHIKNSLRMLAIAAVAVAIGVLLT